MSGKEGVENYLNNNQFAYRTDTTRAMHVKIM